MQDAKSEETAYEAVKSSLAKLDMSYIDLILLHQPMGDYFAAYRGIEKAYKEGLAKAVGVANFYPAILANLCENVDVIPAVNQVELHPFFVQAKALENMKTYGVAPQVALKWNVQRGVSIIPKSVHVERMGQNIDIWDFTLTDDEMTKIAAKDLGHSEIVNHEAPAFVKMLCGRNIH